VKWRVCQASCCRGPQWLGPAVAAALQASCIRNMDIMIGSGRVRSVGVTFSSGFCSIKHDWTRFQHRTLQWGSCGVTCCLPRCSARESVDLYHRNRDSCSTVQGEYSKGVCGAVLCHASG
jgi:hypothetical protein